jgi:hypothetical protein
MSKYKLLFAEAPLDGENPGRMDGVVELHVQLPFGNAFEGETFGFSNPIDASGFCWIYGIASLQCVCRSWFFTGTSFEWIAGKKKYTSNQGGYVNMCFHYNLLNALKYVGVFSTCGHDGPN